MNERPALFLDRDGTIMVDKHYLGDPADIEFIPGVVDAISKVNDIDIPVIVVTNQSGIERGFFTEKTLNNIHETMKEMMRDSGCHVTDVYYCPHKPESDCLCRKPGIALFERAAVDYKLTLEDSIIVGDSIMDAGAALNIGCMAIIPSPTKNNSARCIELAGDILWGVTNNV